MSSKPFRILFIADGRSPTALNWIQYFVERGDEVHLASTFPAAPDLRLKSLTFIPLAFSQAKTVPAGSGVQKARKTGWIWGAGAVGLRMKIRQWLGPLTVPAAGRRLHALVEQIRPELLHAMRIPYEGMAAASALSGQRQLPFLQSIWGNDFTLHAPSSPLMGWQTRQTLRAATALHADCQRDIRLAYAWGFNRSAPTIVLPGAGGLQLDLFHPLENAASRPPLVINPRGVRTYIRNDTFFQAVPLVLARRPEVKFICTAMQGEPQAETWVQQLNIGHAVQLLPQQTRPAMAGLFQQAMLAVSPSTHDGTPNTLLEAMACGCFPIAGDLDSLREWIDPGKNGLLVDSASPASLAEAILQALDDAELRQRAQVLNQQIIHQRAEYQAVMNQAAEFYKKIRA